MTTKYHIDEMQGDEVVALHIAHGATALEAVSKVTTGPFVVRTVQAHWFRVVDQGRRDVFKFAVDRD
ncbi:MULTISPECIES: hypothetical protein [unclassified Mesorhizobium]|uniref:hypothetical protein n=1 Tax=unclassified Mesorhizobium TaxID=325217 RepID=UPI000BAE6E75|nr:MULTISPECIES: hypothetical protein [unclassified Mesorhizobium]PBB23939.1 hypothetical protein CK232_24440 [Mesorhizobium sp. WSM4304]PBB72900.1 hypothetical protein CK227_24925 [Mesorhizobium sp. WSM4308]